MASSIAVEEPQVLSSLPRPLEEEPSNITAAPVHRLRHGRKLLRQELVVGLNGDSLNLYNIAEPRIITSHAIPPQSSLTTAPCCVYTSRGRFVYAAVQTSVSSAKYTIFCFRQPQPTKNSVEAAEKYQYDFKAQHGPIIHLEAVASEQDSSLLVIQQNGHATLLQDDLSAQKWNNPLHGDASSNVVISHAQSYPAADAIKGVFHARPEIVAMLDPTLSEATGQSLAFVRVLFTMYWDPVRQTNRADAHVLRLSSTTTTQRAALRLVCSWDLQDFHSKHVQYHFDPRDGILQALGKQRLFVYKLSLAKAKKMSQLELRTAGRCSLVSIAPHLSAISSRNGCEVYDIVFSSIQASQTGVPFSGAASTNRKRKRLSVESGVAPTKLIHYFPRLGLLIGLTGNDLISYSVKAERPRKKNQGPGSRLIDAIDKGINFTKSLEQDMEDDITKSLLSFAEKRDVVNFEKLFFQATSAETGAESQAVVKRGPRGKQDAIPLRPVEKSLGVRGQQLARVAMGSIFVRETAEATNTFGSTDLRLRFFPSSVLRWLSLCQLLTPDHVGRAMKPRLSTAALVAPLTQEAIVAAVANADPSLVMLADIVIKGNVTSHRGLVRAVRILLRSFDNVPDYPETSQPRLTLQQSQNQNEDEENDSDEHDFASETRAAEWELDMASILLEDGPSGRGLALRTCCEKLAGSASAKQVARSLREEMTRRDLSLLIDLLRYELHSGGWTTHFTGRVDTDQDNPQDGVIWVICELLNRVLDALGTGGWVGMLPSSNGSQEQEVDELGLIGELRADVFSTLEGVQESNFFCGFLRDFIRYKETLRSAGPRRAGRDGEIESDWTRGEERMLPLGLDEVKGVSSTKVGAGGEIQARSRRDVARKLDKRVPVYSFERIHV